jgi:hypothetical protein
LWYPQINNNPQFSSIHRSYSNSYWSQNMTSRIYTGGKFRHRTEKIRRRAGPRAPESPTMCLSSDFFFLTWLPSSANRALLRGATAHRRCATLASRRFGPSRRQTPSQDHHLPAAPSSYTNPRHVPVMPYDRISELLRRMWPHWRAARLRSE